MSREYTTKILELVKDGSVDKDNLIHSLLAWMDERDVREFYLHDGGLGDTFDPEDPDDDLEEGYEHDGQPDEAQEWHDFDPDC